MTNNGGTALMHAFRKACQQGNMQLVQQIVQRGISLDAPQEDGCTGLWLAAEAGHAECVNLLCVYGANTGTVKLQGSVSCLYVAAQNGHVHVVDCLLQHHADPDQAKDSGATPLFISAQQGNLEIVNVLLAAKAQPDQPTRTGVTPLMIACFQGHAHIVRALIASGADPERVGAGKTAEEWAESNNTLDLVRTVLKRTKPQPPQPPVPPSRAPLSPRLTAAVLPQQQPLYALPSPYTELQTATTPHTKQSVQYYPESPDQEGAPSKAYASIEPSLTKLFKIKDAPIDLEAGVQKELAKRRQRQSSCSGGSEKSTKRSQSRGQQRKKETIEPTFVKREKARAAQYRNEARKAADTKKFSRPADFFEDHLEHEVPVDSAWQDFKYKLASMEDELHKTEGKVADKWMFNDTELYRRNTRMTTVDQENTNNLVTPLMKHKIFPEASPQRHTRQEEENARAVLKPHNRPYQLNASKVNKLAEAMGASDPTEVQRRVAELASLNSALEDRSMKESEDEKASHVSGLSDPPSVPSLKASTPVGLRPGSRPPSAPATHVPSVASRRSSVTQSLNAVPETLATKAEEPTEAAPVRTEVHAALFDSEEEDHLSQTSAALLERVAARRSSRSQSRATSVQSLAEP